MRGRHPFRAGANWASGAQGSIVSRVIPDPMALVPTTVQYTKWNGALHWRHDLVRLGEDEHGVWLGGPQGAILQRGHEPPIAARAAGVQLIRPDVMWTAIFNGEGGKYAIYIDITTTPKWVSDDRVELVDLDLDVVRHNDGRAELLDEDEFEEHRQLYAYPPSLVEATRATAAQLITEVEARAEPFDTAAQPWLAQLADLS